MIKRLLILWAVLLILSALAGMPALLLVALSPPIVLVCVGLAYLLMYLLVLCGYYVYQGKFCSPKRFWDMMR